MSDETTVVPPAGATPPAAEVTPPAATPPAGTDAGAGGANADGKPATPPAGEQQPPANEEPPVRKTREDYIKERQDAKAAKDAAGAKPPVTTPPEAAEELHPDDIAIVEKVIESKYGKTFAELNQHNAALAEQALNGEITDFVKDNPQFKGHEAAITKYAKHDAYKRLPIEQVAYAAVGKTLMKLGADAAREADKNAAESATGGGSARGTQAGKVDWSTASNEQMEAEIMRVKGQV